MNPQYLQGIPVLIRLVYLRTLRRRIGLFVIIHLELAIDACVLSDNLNINPNSIALTFKTLILSNYFALVLSGFSLLCVHNLGKNNQNYFICLVALSAQNCDFLCWHLGGLCAGDRARHHVCPQVLVRPPGVAHDSRDLQKEIIFKKTPDGFYLFRFHLRYIQFWCIIHWCKLAKQKLFSPVYSDL